MKARACPQKNSPATASAASPASWNTANRQLEGGDPVNGAQAGDALGVHQLEPMRSQGGSSSDPGTCRGTPRGCHGCRRAATTDAPFLVGGQSRTMSSLVPKAGKAIASSSRPSSASRLAGARPGAAGVGMDHQLKRPRSSTRRSPMSPMIMSHVEAHLVSAPSEHDDDRWSRGGRGFEGRQVSSSRTTMSTGRPSVQAYPSLRSMPSSSRSRSRGSYSMFWRTARAARTAPPQGRTRTTR